MAHKAWRDEHPFSSLRQWQDVSMALGDPTMVDDSKHFHEESLIETWGAKRSDISAYNVVASDSSTMTLCRGGDPFKEAILDHDQLYRPLWGRGLASMNETCWRLYKDDALEQGDKVLIITAGNDLFKPRYKCSQWIRQLDAWNDYDVQLSIISVVPDYSFEEAAEWWGSCKI